MVDSLDHAASDVAWDDEAERIAVVRSEPLSCDTSMPSHSISQTDKKRRGRETKEQDAGRKYTGGKVTILLVGE